MAAWADMTSYVMTTNYNTDSAMKFVTEYWMSFLCSPHMSNCYKEIKTQRLSHEWVVKNVRAMEVWDLA